MRIVQSWDHDVEEHHIPVHSSQLSLEPNPSNYRTTRLHKISEDFSMRGGNDIQDAWVSLKRCDANMTCKLHAMTLELLPVSIPPVFHANLSLQFCDNDNDWDPLLADPSVKRVAGPSTSMRGRSAVYAVHQKADTTRLRVHELTQ